jgi:hypothetical protein
MDVELDMTAVGLGIRWTWTLETFLLEMDMTTVGLGIRWTWTLETEWA